MKNLLKVAPLLLIFLGALMLFEKPAYAYADPGTGLLAIQAAGSALIATGWYLRRKIAAIFHRGAAAKEHSDAPVAVEDEGSTLS